MTTIEKIIIFLFGLGRVLLVFVVGFFAMIIMPIWGLFQLIGMMFTGNFSLAKPADMINYMLDTIVLGFDKEIEIKEKYEEYI